MITLRQLLSHTSGVRPYLPETTRRQLQSSDLQSWRFFRLTRFSLPGTRFEYGGLAMQIAYRMAEKSNE